MLRKMYSFRVWEALRDGKQIFAVVFGKSVPYIVDMSKKTVAEVTEFMNEHNDDNCLYLEPDEDTEVKE